MTNYLKKIKEDANNINEILEFFEQEYENARDEVKIKGNLNKNIADLSGNYENRFSQLQELEAIMDYFDTKLKGIKSSIYQKCVSNSQRALNANDIKQYVEGDKNIIELQLMINDIALVRNKFVSLTKGFETKNFMLSNLTKLQCAGLDNVEI